jgi:hypothetical protein
MSISVDQFSRQRGSPLRLIRQLPRLDILTAPARVRRQLLLVTLRLNLPIYPLQAASHPMLLRTTGPAWPPQLRSALVLAITVGSGDGSRSESLSIGSLPSARAIVGNRIPWHQQTKASR